MKSSKTISSICIATFHHLKNCSIKEIYYWIAFIGRSFIFTSFAKIIEFKTLLDYLHIEEGEKVCDLGCGHGDNDVLLSLAGAKMYAVDIDRDALKLAKGNTDRLSVNVNHSVADLNKATGFKTESFDKVLSFCVLEHLSNPEAFLREAHRILNSRGTMAISIDSFSGSSISDELKKTHKKVCDVKRYYTKREAELLLNKCRFSVVRSSFIIKSPISSILFETLLRTYFHSEIFEKSAPLKIFKLFSPIALVVCMISDHFCDDSRGGYWLALLAAKET